jgi:hypothetical protein
MNPVAVHPHTLTERLMTLGALGWLWWPFLTGSVL